MKTRILLAAAAALGLAGCNAFGCMGAANNGREAGKCTLSTTFLASAQIAPHAPAPLETKS